VCGGHADRRRPAHRERPDRLRDLLDAAQVALDDSPGELPLVHDAQRAIGRPPHGHRWLRSSETYRLHSHPHDSRPPGMTERLTHGVPPPRRRRPRRDRHDQPPDKLNALNAQVIGELDRMFTELGQREDVGAIILTGAGRAFVAGADIAEVGRRPRRPKGSRPPPAFGTDVFTRIERSASR
jgi:hypothetical protein